jgi:thioredoxin reductase
MLDVIIVGAGPAGLSAALLLGRCRRQVLLCDSGTPRNYAARGVHGFLTRDGLPPSELRAFGRQELSRYGVEYRDELVECATLCPVGFEVEFASGHRTACRKLLLATGVMDELPGIPGMQDCYGQSAFHCPYCDGWEVRDRRLALYARGHTGVGMAHALTTWSADVLLCTDGPGRIQRRERQALAAAGIRVREERVAGLEHDAGALRAVTFDRGSSEPRDALFFVTRQQPQSDLAARLGCRFNKKGAVRTSRLEETGVPGLYVAGDASRDVQLAIVAAAEGAKAAFAINSALVAEHVARLRDQAGEAEDRDGRS